MGADAGGFILFFNLFNVAVAILVYSFKELQQRNQCKSQKIIYEIEYMLIWMSWTCMKKSKQFSSTSSFNKEKRIIMSYHQISFEYQKPVSSSLSLSRFWKCNCSQHNNTTCLDRYLLHRNKIWIRPVIVIIIASILHFTKKIFQGHFQT